MSGRQLRTPSESNGPGRLLVVGLGNPMMGDDGIGLAVIERLRRGQTPPGVRVEALAGDVLGLADVWANEPEVWLVDAVDGGSPVGSLQVIEHRTLLALPGERLSTHHLSLGESLRWLLHGMPEMAAIDFTLYGIEIGTPRPEPGLRPEIEESVARLASAVLTAASAQPLEALSGESHRL